MKPIESVYVPKHGMAKTRIYSIWRNMKNRCRYPSARNYLNYGGRGITYDPKWETFEGFYEDMHEGYSDDLTLDRKDVNGNYCKDNCQWLEPVLQHRNKRGNIKVVYQGEECNLIDLYHEINPPIPYKNVLGRVQNGWDVHEAFTKPVDSRYGRRNKK